MKVRNHVPALLIAFASLSINAQTKIKSVELSPTPASSGPKMFTTYCAVCHGMDGKGGGPAASALKATPADLTVLRAHNNGKFPENQVIQSIDGTLDISAHGSKDMPVYGDLFHRMKGGNAPEAHLRLVNLTKYVESLQQK